MFVVFVAEEGLSLCTRAAATSEGRCLAIGRATMIAGNKEREAAAAADRMENEIFMVDEVVDDSLVGRY